MGRRNRTRWVPRDRITLSAFAVGCWGLVTGANLSAPTAHAAGPNTAVTFNRDIAPIVFAQCSPCHHPGQTSPFNLLTYDDVKKRVDQIVEVTKTGVMPPWHAERGEFAFANERRLAPREIRLISEWARSGAPQGEAQHLPPAPTWQGEWELGTPDYIAELPQAFELGAEGRDVYRNFVIPLTGLGRRFVRAVEFRPGTNRVIHHAFINLDGSRVSRRMATGNPPGFDGMVLPETTRMPEGQLLSWQPGRRPSGSAGGLAWTLEPESDLVIQLHLRPSGKKEQVRPRVGFYFADQPATLLPFRVNLSQLHIDLPPGDADHHVKNEFTLPVDVRVLGVLPHLHYLGKTILGQAVLPSGETKELLRISRWNFDWQTDYAYRDPVFLPRGTVLKMDFSYDNSTNNPANPNQPPKRVVYGSQTSDEMAELWLQLLPTSAADRDQLGSVFGAKLAKDSLDYNEFVIRQNPADAVARTRVAKALVASGQDGIALEHLKQAIRSKPDHDKAYYEIGAILLRQGRLEASEKSFLAVLRFNPDDYQAYGSLGIVYMRQGRLDEAERSLTQALSIHPGDTVAKKNLEAVIKARTGTPKP